MVAIKEDYPGATKKRLANRVIQTLNQWIYNNINLDKKERSTKVWIVKSKSTGSGVHRLPRSPKWMLEQIPQMQKKYSWVTRELVIALYPYLTGSFYDGIVTEECMKAIDPFLDSINL